MPKTYLPQTDGGLLVWATNLSDHLTADPAAYGTTAEQAAQYRTTLTRYADALSVVRNPDTRTGPAVRTKDAARGTLRNASRMTVNLLQAWPQMDDSKRDALRITVRDRTPSPVPPPAAVPMLEVLDVRGRRMTVQLRDTEGRAKRPVGVKGANVYTCVGESPAGDLSAWKFEGAMTRTRFDIDFAPTLPGGTKVWLTAAWFNPRMQTGLACDPVPTQVNFGGVSKAA